MIKKLNKRAGEKIFSVWWFFCLAMVGAAVVVMAMTKFGAFVDVRGIDATMLREKILDCIVENGYLEETVLGQNSETLLDLCKLNKNQFRENSLYFFNLTIYNSVGLMQKNFTSGRIHYQEDCEVALEIRAEKYPFCSLFEGQIIYFDEKTAKKEEWRIYLLIASNNHGYKETILRRGGE